MVYGLPITNGDFPIRYVSHYQRVKWPPEPSQIRKKHPGSLRARGLSSSSCAVGVRAFGRTAILCLLKVTKKTGPGNDDLSGDLW